MGKTDNKHINTIYCVANGDKYFGGKKIGRGEGQGRIGWLEFEIGWSE